MNELLTTCLMLTGLIAGLGFLIWKLDRAAYLAFKEDGSGEIPPTFFKFSD